MRPLDLPVLLTLTVTLGACTTDGTGPGESEFVIRGSASAVASASAQLNVDPISFSLAFFEVRLSANTDCTGPYVTAMTASPARRLDLSTNPEIVRVVGLPAGTYPCVAMRISDLLQFVPASTEGSCIAGTNFTHDIYRVGNEVTPYLDITGNPITARGTDATPVEDAVWTFLSTNPAAVAARGYNPNQVVLLSAQLQVPGSTTFYWDASNGLQSTASGCDIVSGAVGFR